MEHKETVKKIGCGQNERLKELHDHDLKGS